MRQINPNYQIGISEELHQVDVYSHGVLLAKSIKAKFVINSLRPNYSKLYLFPGREHYKEIVSKFEFEIKGSWKDGANRENSITVVRATPEESSETLGGDDLYENFIRLHPDTIERRIRNLGSSEGGDEVWFTVSENHPYVKRT